VVWYEKEISKGPEAIVPERYFLKKHLQKYIKYIFVTSWILPGEADAVSGYLFGRVLVNNM
jgi:hypothetical protein